MAGGQSVDAQYTGCAHELHRKRRTRAGGMATHQVQLQLCRIGGRDRNVREAAETGGYAVDRLTGGELLVDQPARGRDALARVARNANFRAVRCDGANRLKSKLPAVKIDGARSFGTRGYSIPQFGARGAAKGGPA